MTTKEAYTAADTLSRARASLCTAIDLVKQAARESRDAGADIDEALTRQAERLEVEMLAVIQFHRRLATLAV